MFLMELPDDLLAYVVARIANYRPDHVAVVARTCRVIHAGLSVHLAYRRRLAEHFLVQKLSLPRGELSEKPCDELNDENNSRFDLRLQGLTGQEMLLFLNSFAPKHSMPRVRTLEVSPSHSMDALVYALEKGCLPQLAQLHVDLDAVAEAHRLRLRTTCESRAIRLDAPPDAKTHCLIEAADTTADVS